MAGVNAFFGLFGRCIGRGTTRRVDEQSVEMERARLLMSVSLNQQSRCAQALLVSLEADSQNVEGHLSYLSWLRSSYGENLKGHRDEFENYVSFVMELLLANTQWEVQGEVQGEARAKADRKRNLSLLLEIVSDLIYKNDFDKTSGEEEAAPAEIAPHVNRLFEGCPSGGFSVWQASIITYGLGSFRRTRWLRKCGRLKNLEQAVFPLMNVFQGEAGVDAGTIVRFLCGFCELISFLDLARLNLDFAGRVDLLASEFKKRIEVITEETKPTLKVRVARALVCIAGRGYLSALSDSKKDELRELLCSLLPFFLYFEKELDVSDLPGLFFNLDALLGDPECLGIFSQEEKCLFLKGFVPLISLGKSVSSWKDAFYGLYVLSQLESAVQFLDKEGKRSLMKEMVIFVRPLGCVKFSFEQRRAALSRVCWLVLMHESLFEYEFNDEERGALGKIISDYFENPGEERYSDDIKKMVEGALKICSPRGILLVADNEQCR